MRPRLEKLGSPANLVSFTCYRVSVPFFEFYWHFHPEYELTLILNGKGNRLVGNNIEPFEKGDLVLLGPNLPHVWVSEEKNGGPCEAFVIQFPESFIQNLLLFPEWNCLYNLVQHSGKGMAYSKISKKELELIRLQMQQIAEANSLLNLIELLCQLAGKTGQPLSTEVFSSEKPSKDATRLNAILHFIHSHYLQPIILEDAAKSIHLSSSAFSKFFLRKMGKPFTTYLNELRIAHACQLLIETDNPISLIGNASGFENHSYFNRVFLKQKKVSPSGFRKIRK
jgi:AraC-like DNA-binding protein